MAKISLSNWSPNLVHVDTRISQRYVLGTRFTVVGVTKMPFFHQITDFFSEVKLVGGITDFSAPQQKPVIDIPEIGSQYTYGVTGRYTGQINLSGIFFDAVNLLGALFEDIDSEGTLIYKPTLAPSEFPRPNAGDTGSGESSNQGVVDTGAVLLTLNDTLTERAIGMALIIMQRSARFQLIGSATPTDTDNTGGQNASIREFGAGAETFMPIGGVFFENCKARMYNIAISANQEIIPETVVLRYDRALNLRFSSSGVQALPIQ